MKLIIEDDEGRKTVVPFVREEITIGRQEGNTIRLTERNVSRRHARLVRQNGHVTVEDLGSYNGIKINGERIQGQTPIRDGDLIQIGDYDLAIQSEGALAAGTNGAAHPPPQRPATAVTPVGPMEASTPTPVPGGEDAATEAATPIFETPPPTGGSPSASRNEATAVIRLEAVDGAPKRPVAALDPRSVPRIVVLNTDYAGRDFPLSRTEIQIGRTDDNDIALDHRSLSRVHCKVFREESGELAIRDMESANGVTVNGERYAQVTLRSGDLIELGHVKLKFLAPGASFRAMNPKAKMLFGAGLVALALAVVFGALIVSRSGPEKPHPQLTPIGTALPHGPDNTVPPEQPPDVEAKLHEAEQAIQKQDFAQVPIILGPTKNADGTYPERVQQVMKQAEEERSNKQTIQDAARAMAQGSYEEADRLLGRAQGTLSFAEEYAKVRKKLDELTRKKPTVATAPKQVDPAKVEQAQGALENGKILLKKKQHKEAFAYFSKCLELDPGHAECHLWMGSAFAKMGNMEKGAQQYREYLRLAPNAENAEKVKAMLRDYEKSKTGPKE